LIKYKINIKDVNFAKFTRKQLIIYFGHVSVLNYGQIDTCIKDNIQQDVSVNIKDIIFGYFDFGPTKNKACFVINLIYFLSKFYIHKSKFNNSKLVFSIFKIRT